MGGFSQSAVADADLVRRAQGGDRGATDELVRRYQPLVRAMARRYYLPVAGDQDDLEQIGWMGFLEAIRTYRTQHGSFKGWAWLVVRCRVIDALQHTRRTRRFPAACPISLDQLAMLDVPEDHVPGRSAYHELIAWTAVERPSVDEQALARLELFEVWRSLSRKLTPQERKVLEAMVICRRPMAYGERDNYLFREVSALTGLSWKQVDNAWMRVKRKLSKLRGREP